MKTIITLWEPNEKWKALSQGERADYLRNLDVAIPEMRKMGIQTLGWSKVDRAFPGAPKEGYVGILAIDDPGRLPGDAFASWDEFFNTQYICIDPRGGLNPMPSEEYARILDMKISE